MTVAQWHAEFRHYRPLIERIIRQTERRVLQGETVAANEKIVSLFEPNADIVVKGGREVEYGHKLNLTTGRSGLILDLVIEAGNPADSERFLPMLKRHIVTWLLYPIAPLFVNHSLDPIRRQALFRMLIVTKSGGEPTRTKRNDQQDQAEKATSQVMLHYGSWLFFHGLNFKLM